MSRSGGQGSSESGAVKAHGVTTAFDLDQVAPRDDGLVTFARFIGDVSPAMIGTGVSYGLGVALVPLRVVGFAVTVWDLDHAADGANFYTFVARHYRGTNSVDIGTKSTTATTFSRRIPVDFRETDIDSSGSGYLRRGDALALFITATLAPPPLQGLHAQALLEPAGSDL